MPDDLKRCPFCGSSRISERKKTVGCDNCGAQGPYGDDQNNVSAWNRRAALIINPEDARQVERVARELCFQRISYTKGSKDRFVWSRWIDENWIYHKTAAQATLSDLKALADE